MVLRRKDAVKWAMQKILCSCWCRLLCGSKKPYTLNPVWCVGTEFGSANIEPHSPNDEYPNIGGGNCVASWASGFIINPKPYILLQFPFAFLFPYIPLYLVPLGFDFGREYQGSGLMKIPRTRPAHRMHLRVIALLK